MKDLCWLKTVSSIRYIQVLNLNSKLGEQDARGTPDFFTFTSILIFIQKAKHSNMKLPFIFIFSMALIVTACNTGAS